MMPASSNIVIILDINSIPKEIAHFNNNDLNFKEDCSAATTNNVEEKCNAVPYQYEVVKYIKETVIALLCKEAVDRQTGRFNFSRVQWSFKLYNSSLELNSKTGRTFHSVDNESIDLFEKQLESYLNPSSQSAIKSDSKINRINFLSTSIKSVLGDLPWPDTENGFDDNKAHFVCVSGMGNRNIIQVLFRVPRSDDEMDNFIPGWTPASGSKSIMNELLPKAFCRKMKEQQIQLNFTDLWTAFEGQAPDSQITIDGVTSSRTMLKIVNYFSGGTIFPFTNISQGVPLGLPSYGSLLKIFIADSTNNCNTVNLNSKATFDENKKTIQKLHGSITGSTKVSPEEADADSFRSSIRDRDSMRNILSKQGNTKNSLSRAVQYRSRENLWPTYNTGSSKRYSDERDFSSRYRVDTHDNMIPKKRKYEFEDDMESEEGYSQREIENWCIKGKVDLKELRTTSTLNRGQFESEQQKLYRHNASVYDKSEALENRRPGKLGRHTKNRYSSPQLLQPQKRLRKEHEDTMAPPTRMTLNKQRHSDPTGFCFKQKPESNEFGSRGRIMVSQGLSKLTSKSKEEKQDATYLEKYKENIFKQKEKSLNALMNRIQLLLKTSRSVEEIVCSDPVKDLYLKISIFKDMVIQEYDTCLASAAQALVSQVGKRLAELKVRDLRNSMETILIIPFEQLNLSVIQRKNTEDEVACFRECQLQVLIQFEMVWAVPDSAKKNAEERFIENTIKILNLIKAYRKNPPIEEFINEILTPLYSVTHQRPLREIALSMNIEPSPMLNDSMDSPGTNYPDDCSLTSVNSSLCCPEDSTSQHPIDNYNSHNQSQNSQRTSMRTASFLSINNPKKAIMMPASRFQSIPATKSYNNLKTQSQSTQSGSVRPSPKSSKPKRVRRNLFDVKASRDPKDMKVLLNMATNSSFTRSPSMFKSPSSKVSYSPRSPARTSPFFTLARARSKPRSRRRFVMDADDGGESSSPIRERLAPLHMWGHLNGSPQVLSDGVICPESPTTPKSKSKAEKLTPGSRHSSLGTTGKSVVQESPEMSKSGYTMMNHPFSRKVNSLSFYSSGTESLKARAWERSGAKLMAARIKDSVDMSSSLTLNDLEFINDNDSPNDKTENNTNNYSKDEGGYQTEPNSPIPCSSNSLMPHLYHKHFESIQTEEVSSSNIEALISSEIFASPSDILNMTGSTSKSPVLDTPSKKVQFSFEKNLVNIPSPSRNSIFGTPKSILKEAGNTPT